MDHRYIDERSVADRYLDHTLTPSERCEFEAHLVDCQECTDRVLLAEMFHNRNGRSKAVPTPLLTAAPSTTPAPAPAPIAEPEPFRVRLVRWLTPWQIFLIFAAAAAL